MLIGQKLCLKSIQFDGVGEYAYFLGSITGLERIYLPEPWAPESKERHMLFHAIATNHGATLQHLVMPVFWHLPTSWIAKLLRTCPNITHSFH